MKKDGSRMVWENFTPIQRKIYAALDNHPAGLDRSGLVKLVGAPRTTIYDNIEKLSRAKYVEVYKLYNFNAGRPKSIFYLRRHRKSILSGKTIKGR